MLYCTILKAGYSEYVGNASGVLFVVAFIQYIYPGIVVSNVGRTRLKVLWKLLLW